MTDDHDPARCAPARTLSWLLVTARGGAAALAFVVCMLFLGLAVAAALDL